MSNDLPSWWAPPPPTDVSATTNERVVLALYAEAMENLREARCGRSTARPDVGKTLNILSELIASLVAREDRDAVANLSSLYHYMIHRLLDPNEAGTDAALDEVTRLLQTLWDGWVQVIQPDVEDGFPDWLSQSDHFPSVASSLSPPS